MGNPVDRCRRAIVRPRGWGEGLRWGWVRSDAMPGDIIMLKYPGEQERAYVIETVDSVLLPNSVVSHGVETALPWKGV